MACESVQQIHEEWETIQAMLTVATNFGEEVIPTDGWFILRETCLAIKEFITGESLIT